MIVTCYHEEHEGNRGPFEIEEGVTICPYCGYEELEEED